MSRGRIARLAFLLAGLFVAGGVGVAIRKRSPRGLPVISKRELDRRDRLASFSGGSAALDLVYPFTSNGSSAVGTLPLFTDDANTKCHVYWNASGTLTDTKGCTWTATGTPPALASSLLFPNGYAASSRRGVGPLDDTNNLKMTAATMDITSGTICALFAITAASTGAQQNIYANHDGTRGYRIFINGTNTSRQVCATMAPSGATPCGALAPLDAPFLACVGHSGSLGYYSLGSSDVWSTIAASTPQAPISQDAYLGRLSSATGAPGNVKIYELWVTSTSPASIDFTALYAKFRGQTSTSGRSLILRRTTAGTWDVNAVTQNGTVSEMRMNEYGAYFDTDWVRFPRGAGIGSGSGGGEFILTPNWASNTGTDKVLVSDEPWGGNTIDGPNIEVKYVQSSDKFQLLVGGTTVLSPAQSFSALATIPIVWRYTAGGLACLSVSGVDTCGALTTVSPGAFLSVGGNLRSTYAIASFKQLGFYQATGSVAVAYAALGDSITEGHFGDSARVTYPEKLMDDLGAGYLVDNHGVTGDIITGMDFRYDSYIAGRGYTHVILLGGINNIMTLSQTGAAVYALWSALADKITAAGFTLITSTVLPFKTSASWTAGKQTELDALNTSILAYCVAHPAVKCFDGYSIFEDPGNADELLPAYEHTDHLHLSAAGHQAFADQVNVFLP